jgi:thioredoxin-like negative regulator of GroEL
MIKIKRLTSWLKQGFGYLVLILIVTTAVDLWRGKDLPQGELPNISGITLQGEMVDIHVQSKDQAVLVYFWGTWCPVCNFVSPAVNTLSNYYPVMTVAMNSGSDEKLQAYLNHNDYQFAVINDPSSNIAQQWAIQVTPTILVFKGGELTYYTSGFTSIVGLWWRMVFS